MEKVLIELKQQLDQLTQEFRQSQLQSQSNSAIVNDRQPEASVRMQTDAESQDPEELSQTTDADWGLVLSARAIAAETEPATALCRMFSDPPPPLIS